MRDCKGAGRACPVLRREKSGMRNCGAARWAAIGMGEGPCRRFRRGQCLHRPAGFAVPQTPSGGRERPPGRRRGDAAVLCKRRTAGFCNAATPGRLAVTRKDIGRARRGTPQAALPPAPFTGGPFRWKPFAKPPPQGAAESSAVCGGESETEQV